MTVRKPGSQTQNSNVVQVLVEYRDSLFWEAWEASGPLSLANQLSTTGFQLDTSYEPVPAEEAFYVRGTIAEKKIKDLNAQDKVIGVWRDTPFAPFAAEVEEYGVFVSPAQATGPCPIPPCDCDHGTAACSKGSIQEVAQYLSVNKLWSKGLKGQGIAVACVDGGITAQGRSIDARDTNDPNWSNKLIPRVVDGWPTNDWGTTGVSWGWHGNLVATDVLGMAPEAKIYDIRIAAGGKRATMSAALAGYQWAINRHKCDGTPHVMSNGYGIYQESWDADYANDPNHPFTRKVVEAINEGICVLFAVGNCGQACPSDRCGNDVGPGKGIWGANGHPMVMTVGAANIKGQYIGYSSQGPAALDLNKPDFCSISHFRGYFSSDTGTSAACSVAAGVVALLKQCKPNLTQEDAKATLKSTAKNIGPVGWDRHSGSGIIQPKEAYCRVAGPTSASKRGGREEKVPPGIFRREGEGVEKTQVFVGYATNREFKYDRFTNDITSGLTYGFCEVSIPEDHNPGKLERPAKRLLWFDETEDESKHIVIHQTSRVPRREFFEYLRDPPADSVLLYVHGYNVTFEDAALRSAQLDNDLRFPGQSLFFSWASHGTKLGYADDGTRIYSSVEDIRGFLEELAVNDGISAIFMLAHSMGCRGLTRALATISGKLSSVASEKFKQLILAEPDISQDVFKTKIAPELLRLGARVTIYASENDKALGVSQKVNSGVPRLGQAGKSIYVQDSIDTVDASDVGVCLLSLNHSEYAQRLEFIHEINNVIDGKKITDRPGVKKVPQMSHWYLFPAS